MFATAPRHDRPDHDRPDHDSFDDPGTPLHQVTFCVVDVETTGASPAACGITEVGAVRLRGGEPLGTFQTLVDPGEPIPPAVAALTGITTAMVMPAPRIDEVLPALLEFVGGAVLVGHNLRFDVAFLDAALAAAGRPPLGHHRIDTVALARRLVRDDPDALGDCRLATLAARFRLAHQPCHRALDDALATGDLLHVLIERAAAFGVFGLDDLLALPRLAGHRQAGKLRLTADLPRAPGVYVFRDAAGRALRVGRASDLRRRVRSYFAGVRDRGTTASLLRETRSIDHVTCASALEAAVLEVRLLHALEPRYDRRRARWRSYRYVVLTGGRRPRLTVTRTAPRPGFRAVLGPLPSTAAARQVVTAMEPVVLGGGVPPLHPAPRSGPAPEPGPADGADPPPHPAPGSAPAPGPADDGDPPPHAAPGSGPAPEPGPADGADPLTEAVAARAAGLARGELRTALMRAVRRQRQFDALRRAGRMVIELPGGRRIELDRGRLAAADGPPAAGSPDLARWLAAGAVEAPPGDGPLPLDMADELACVATWLDRHARDVRLAHVGGVYADRPCSPRS